MSSIIVQGVGTDGQTIIAGCIDDASAHHATSQAFVPDRTESSPIDFDEHVVIVDAATMEHLRVSPDLEMPFTAVKYLPETHNEGTARVIDPMIDRPDRTESSPVDVARTDLDAETQLTTKYVSTTVTPQTKKDSVVTGATLDGLIIGGVVDTTHAASPTLTASTHTEHGGKAPSILDTIEQTVHSAVDSGKHAASGVAGRLSGLVGHAAGDGNAQSKEEEEDEQPSIIENPHYVNLESEDNVESDIVNDDSVIERISLKMAFENLEPDTNLKTEIQPANRDDEEEEEDEAPPPRQTLTIINMNQGIELITVKSASNEVQENARDQFITGHAYQLGIDGASIVEMKPSASHANNPQTTKVEQKIAQVVEDVREAVGSVTKKVIPHSDIPPPPPAHGGASAKLPHLFINESSPSETAAAEVPRTPSNTPDPEEHGDSSVEATQKHHRLENVASEQRGKIIESINLTMEKVSTNAHNVKEAASNKIEQAKDSAELKLNELRDSMHEKRDQAGEKLAAFKETAVAKGDEVKDAVKEKIHQIDDAAHKTASTVKDAAINVEKGVETAVTNIGKKLHKAPEPPTSATDKLDGAEAKLQKEFKESPKLEYKESEGIGEKEKAPLPPTTNNSDSAPHVVNDGQTENRGATWPRPMHHSLVVDNDQPPTGGKNRSASFPRTDQNGGGLQQQPNFLRQMRERLRNCTIL